MEDRFDILAQAADLGLNQQEMQVLEAEISEDFWGRPLSVLANHLGLSMPMLKGLRKSPQYRQALAQTKEAASERLQDLLPRAMLVLEQAIDGEIKIDDIERVKLAERVVRMDPRKIVSTRQKFRMKKTYEALSEEEIVLEVEKRFESPDEDA